MQLGKNKKPKFYVVWDGLVPGIYTSWDECQQHVLGIQGAKYKSFQSQKEAIEAFSEGSNRFYENNPVIKKEAETNQFIPDFIQQSIVVDGAFSSSKRETEYQGVYLETNEKLFQIGPIHDGSNNLGEFLAIVHALALCKQKGWKIPIYSDSFTAITWVRKGTAGTKLERTAQNKKIFELVDRAQTWLATNQVINPIFKWETEIWGENPADFGRK